MIANPERLDSATLRAWVPWDRELNATCPENNTNVVFRHQPTLRTISAALRTTAIRLCTAACTRSKSCVAFVLTAQSASWKCDLKAQCSLLVPGRQDTTFFKPLVTWPAHTNPGQIVWQRPAAIFITWFHHDLSWLRELSRADVLDVVVYARGGGDVSEPKRHTDALRFFKQIPNFGITGGGREAHAMWQFLVDFYRNLPEVILFSQDDCSGGRCPWQQHYPKLPALLREPSRSFARLDRDSCLCQWIHERGTFAPQKYLYYDWMEWYDRNFFGVRRGAADSGDIQWPRAAMFAVHRDRALRRSRNFYRLSRTLSIVEFKWRQSIARMFAHAFERLWFHVFDFEDRLPDASANGVEWETDAPGGSTASSRLRRTRGRSRRQAHVNSSRSTLSPIPATLRFSYLR